MVNNSPAAVSVLAESLNSNIPVLKDVTSIASVSDSQATTSFSEPKQTISFSNVDEVQNAETKVVSTEEAPKDVVSLERRAEENYQKQLAMEEEDNDDDDRIKIHGGENIVLDIETL